MIKVTFIDTQGASRALDAVDGQSLMDVAVSNRVPGIDADCGGSCACGTCHVMVAPEWLVKLPPAEDMENAMLEFVEPRTPGSRLSCQIKLSPALDGIVVTTPAGQH
ncbi:MAG: 2Fe-2S iron-sulfur cluster-binding protein [Nevskia sp.]|nr:2Fe-2S iron-sulfur cluster-binding protein [Nevskia sp.]